MPELQTLGDPAAMVRQIRGYVQGGKMQARVVQGLTLTAVADLIESVEDLKQDVKDHEHPEIKTANKILRWVVTPVGIAIGLGALTLIWGVLTHSVAIVSAVP